MEATELRIGNWVNDVADGGVLTEIQDGDDIDFAKDYEPIPLTEEWLVKFGFEKSSGYWLNDCHFIYLESDEDGFTLANPDACSVMGITMNHLHQLQNLYYALTGEELEVKQCKYIKREGESCTLNNNCTYPNCK